MKTLRTPEELLNSMTNEMPFNLSEEIKPYVLELAKIVQKESWNAAVRASAKAATADIKYGGCNYEGEKEAFAEVDQDSILTLIEE